MAANSTKPKSDVGARLTATFCGAMVLALFAAYFGLLILAVFEVFRLLDRIISGQWDLPNVTLAVAAGLLLMFAVRIASRLAASILGLVTERIDSGQWLEQQSELLEPEPELAAAVDRVCERVQATPPDELRLSCDQHCYVVEQRSFALRTRRRRILVMGMPQMLTMTVGEVQVILAHELAHFRSGDTTLTVFLFRLAETARRQASQLGQQRLWMLDPAYWYFRIFHHLFQWTSAPWRRTHELLADRASALAFGGELAAHTLLKDWFIEWKFDESLEAYLKRCADASRDETVYEHFMQRWQDFTPESHAYLEKRLEELERPAIWEAQPTVGHRLRLMRRCPDVAPVDTRFVLDLISEPQLLRVERSLSDKLLARCRQQDTPRQAVVPSS